MKKLLLASTALVGLTMMAAPASAAIKLDLGGYFLGYGVNVNDDTADVRNFDLRRDSEVYVSGETTLDNGTTVGFHTEQDLGADGTLTDEVYAYFSGGWGRVNIGSEDGAAYLLQVGAPSADSNVDGMRVYIQGFNEQQNQLAFVGHADGVAGAGNVDLDATTLGTAYGYNFALDYDQADFRQTDRLTYLSPKISGFQAGVSWAPEEGQNAVGNNVAAMAADNGTTQIFNLDAGAVAAAGGTTTYENVWDAAVRWDGEFQGVGIAAGAGYSTAGLQESTADITAGAAVAAGDRGDYTLNDGYDSWNVGANLTWNSFSLGGVFKRDQTSILGTINDAVNGAAIGSMDITRDTWVVGGAWDNGPYHLGVSYLDAQTENDSLSNSDGVANAADFEFVGTTNEAHKWTAGAGYTFGPGVTFRGSVAWGEYEGTDVVAGAITHPNNDFQQIAVGTDIQF